MKIYTLTCHDVYNYGASLQAFALQKYLLDKGHDAKIINYKPDYIDARYRFSWFITPSSKYYQKCKNNFLLHLFYVVRRYLIQYKTISRKLAFDTFTSKYLSVTRKYSSYLDLCHDAPEGDVYIVGSDQVWNNSPLLNGWDAAFFLQFGNNRTKRVSYAASFGSTKECSDLMAKWIKSLDAVSIREKSSMHFLDEMDINGMVVCDPVFLLDSKVWINTLGLKRNKEKYVLIYNLSGDNKEMLSHAKELAKRCGYKVHYLATQHKQKGFVNINGAGPKKFLEEIMNAECVFSDSFHATAFSIILNVPFFTYRFGNDRASRRMTDLLDNLKLMDRYNPQSIPEDFSEFNVDSEDLKRYIDASKNWLDTQINTAR